MSTLKTVTRTVRIKREVAEYFKEKPLNRYIESMYEHILSGEIEEEDSGISVHTKMIQNGEKGSTSSVHTDNEYEKRLKMNAAPFGISPKELCLKLLDGMDSGKIIYENGEFRAEEKYDLSKLEEECRCRGVPIEKVISSMIQMIERM